ncbi:hypothetical protein J2045_003933 [Peteryoungia aggregata LMG 23059]|uniref:Uncharacterized protein n=1 Tax=Peteryoungia aggregata LMG 23059 TaxID=1368425 RepID=A0ABU0GC02_9HYPH|nr:hypothetical protein [Peteryoungia aggregata LMG 23059]
MLPSKDEGVWLLRGLALRGLLAQAPQGEGRGRAFKLNYR